MKQGFDKRIVSYEYIHSISPEDFNKLIDAVDPKDGEVILDAMCGYGAVGKAILERAPGINLYLNDESSVQIERAVENVPGLDKSHFDTHQLPDNNYAKGYFDKIIVKMGLHEVSLTKHLEILKEFYSLLKPNGKVIVWDIMLSNETQELFQEIIRKKDALAGYDMLTNERYFFREDEFIENARQAGFANITEFHTIHYTFSSEKRLEQELGSRPDKLKELNEFIREKFTPELKKLLDFKDDGDNISFTITKKIFVLGKQ